MATDKPKTAPARQDSDLVPLRKRLAMDESAQTGAGKGPYGGNMGKKTPC